MSGLIISRRPNGGYNGKHKAEASALVKAGTRVGFVWIDLESSIFYCHVCQTDRTRPQATLQEKVDHMEPCLHCKTPFIFATWPCDSP